MFGLAKITTYVDFVAVGTIFIFLNTCFDAALAKRRVATIALFWPIKNHFADHTDEL
jgi:hypothetical protein